MLFGRGLVDRGNREGVVLEISLDVYMLTRKGSNGLRFTCKRIDLVACHNRIAASFLDAYTSAWLRMHLRDCRRQGNNGSTEAKATELKSTLLCPTKARACSSIPPPDIYFTELKTRNAS